MESDQHILGHTDSGSASCLHIFVDKAMEETVYLWYKYDNEAKIQYCTIPDTLFWYSEFCYFKYSTNNSIISVAYLTVCVI